LSIGSSISYRLFVILFGAIGLVFFTYSAISNHYRDRMTLDLVRAQAFQAAGYITESLVTEMMDKDRSEIQHKVEQLGADQGIQAIRIYNSQGEIRFSASEGEIGTVVPLTSSACIECHGENGETTPLDTGGQARIYTREDGGRLLGSINPILNRPGCSQGGCHEEDRRVLGILDVQLSMASVDSAMATAARKSSLVGLGIVFLAAILIALIVFRSVHVPASRLQRATEALAAGDLDVSIDMKRTDELGQLAQSFNYMARSLRAADRELREWSETLEDRVREKTEEIERINRQMIQVEKSTSLGRMAATVAHELNNPLSGIVTYSKVLARKVERSLPEGPERDKVLEELEVIREEGLRCGRIVQDLLTFARESPQEFKPEHLHSVIERAVKLVQHHLELSSVDIVLTLEAEDDQLVCDSDQVVQALMALMINAVEAMPDGGELRLRTGPGKGDPDGNLSLWVADTGSGIPEAIRDRIFDPFFSTKSETKGVGLGLAVVYGIVRRHGGKIELQSRPDEGAVFHIELPRQPVGEVVHAGRGPDMSEWRT
jgi:two-component system NtrC family sensor kinase